eukprot:EST46055.1 hypothetical protein SS50377_14045 [Spironucleus salmonicida]
MTLRDVLMFVNPPTQQHTPSLFYLKLLAYYGPPVNNGIANSDGRILSKYEIRPMLDIYEQEILTIMGKAGVSNLRHPKNLEILTFVENSLIYLKKKKGKYSHGFTLDTEIYFDDFSQAVETYFDQFVLKICQ